MIRMRKEVPEFGWGEFEVLLTNDHSDADARGRHRIIMEPYGYHWYRVGGLGYLLERTEF